MDKKKRWTMKPDGQKTPIDKKNDGQRNPIDKKNPMDKETR